MTTEQKSRPQEIVDYDSDGYDYRGFWHGRDYEQWAEKRVLRRLIAGFGRPQWLADFGGGFGRNAEHYRDRAENAVLVDYSVTNLERAAQLHRRHVDEGRMHLVRCDLNHLPFMDSAFDCGMVVRVLHHLPEVELALSEMARTVGRDWIVDVPIKHHLLGRVRAAVQGEWGSMASPEPRVTGDSRYPFHNFRLDVVRGHLASLGWQTSVVASVNNFRRWDRLVPRSAVPVLRPLVYSVESVAQTVGRGWWGPSQFLLARRRPARFAELNPAPESLSSGDTALARRMCCPTCRGQLQWTANAALCPVCSVSYPKRGEHWDFVAD